MLGCIILSKQRLTVLIKHRRNIPQLTSSHLHTKHRILIISDPLKLEKLKYHLNAI